MTGQRNSVLNMITIRLYFLMLYLLHFVWFTCYSAFLSDNKACSLHRAFASLGGKRNTKRAFGNLNTKSSLENF